MGTKTEIIPDLLSHCHVEEERGYIAEEQRKGEMCAEHFSKAAWHPGHPVGVLRVVDPLPDCFPVTLKKVLLNLGKLALVVGGSLFVHGGFDRATVRSVVVAAKRRPSSGGGGLQAHSR